MSVEKLFTEYADAVNSGKPVKIEEFLARCPERNREELKGLTEMIDILREATVPVKPRQEKVDCLFAHLEERRKARNQVRCQPKMVANFRADDDLSGEEKKAVDDVMDKLWTEKFGKDEK